MADRHRSSDGSRDTDRIPSDAAPSHSGRDGGRLARRIGTEDELKRAGERPAGKTRVHKSDEQHEDEEGRRGDDG
jgi:hypothetical protein